MYQKKTQVILYGLGGPEKQYRCLRYEIFPDDMPLTTRSIRFLAGDMMRINPDIQTVYMIDNRPQLGKEYVDSWRINSIESCYIFKDTLEREGIKIF